ncbi:clathrin light chain B isoform X2 [Pelodiscus sinensis]|uniref:clathrin light chain B isoform X2 n=1 Tax=Pelodiscus sinensis TaxID=13735 RepID=UPI003F6B2658
MLVSARSRVCATFGPCTEPRREGPARSQGVRTSVASRTKSFQSQTLRNGGAPPASALPQHFPGVALGAAGSRWQQPTPHGPGWLAAPRRLSDRSPASTGLPASPKIKWPSPCPGFPGAEWGDAADCPSGFEETGAAADGDVFQEPNGPTDAYEAVARADRLTQEPESIRQWREEQKKRLQELDAASKVLEQEWRDKARRDLEEWHVRQTEQMEKNRVNNRASEEAFLRECEEEDPGTEWEKVAQLCDFNPKSSKQCKDVSRMRSVLISLKQTPLSR